MIDKKYFHNQLAPSKSTNDLFGKSTDSVASAAVNPKLERQKSSVAIARRNKHLANLRQSFVEQQHVLYSPIYKLDKGPYTQDEWVCILMNSIQKIQNEAKIKRGLGLQIEHLSHNRLRTSLFQGLDKVDCESLRGEIWKLICKV